MNTADATSPPSLFADRLSSTAHALLAGLADHPLDDTPRLILRDCLMDDGCWDWPTVRDIVLDRPECDGRRLLAADWFEDEDADVPEFQARKGELHYESDGRATGTYLNDVPTPAEMLSNRQRAEFVRVQCDLARLKPNWAAMRAGCLCDTCQKAAPLADRERDLLLRINDTPGLPTNWTIWVKPTGAGYLMNVYTGVPLSPPNTTATFRRGWVDEVEITADRWLSHGDAITAEHPVTTVTLTALPGMERKGDHYVRLIGRERWWHDVDDSPRRGSGRPLDGIRELLWLEWPRVKTWNLPAAVVYSEQTVRIPAETIEHLRGFDCHRRH
jgi:hypothetical protein